MSHRLPGPTTSPLWLSSPWTGEDAEGSPREHGVGWDWAFERDVPFGRRKSSQCLLPQEFQKLETLEMVGRAWALGITQLAGDAPPELWDQGQVFISALSFLICPMRMTHLVG